MNLKTLSILITLLFLITAEILSHINLCIWDMISNSPSYSERYYYKKKLTSLYNLIEKLRVSFYFFFIISVIASIGIYIFY